MNPILFLDIDGVLNSVSWSERRVRPIAQGWMWEAEYNLDPDAVAILNRICSRTRCAVVLSSTWRKSHALTMMNRLLSFRGFKVGLIGATPMIGGANHGRAFVGRGEEIHEWLRMAGVLTPYPITPHPIAILDDDSDMEPFMDRLVQTDCEVGLTDDDADRCIELLMEK